MKTRIEQYCQQVAENKDRELTINLETRLNAVQVAEIIRIAKSCGVCAYFSNWSVLIQHNQHTLKKRKNNV